jgi:hypothetical protein
MTHTDVRFLILIGALMAAAGSARAQQPPDPVEAPAPTESPAQTAASPGQPADSVASTPPTPAPKPATPPGPSADTIKKARDGGLKPEVRKGVTVFCWEDADIGSRFKTKKCVDEFMLAQILEIRQLQREQLQRSGSCNGGACGGSK